MGGLYPGGRFSGGRFPSGAIVIGGLFPAGDCLGGDCPDTEKVTPRNRDKTRSEATFPIAIISLKSVHGWNIFGFNVVLRPL